MSWLFEKFEGFFQILVLDSILAQTQWVDWALLVFVIVGILYGIQNGLMSEMADIVQMTIVIVLVLSLYEGPIYVIQKYLRFVPNESVKALGFIVTAVAIWVAIGLIFRLLKSLVHTKTAVPLKVTGGAVLGGIHLIMIYSLISQAVILMPMPTITAVYQKGRSYTGYYIAKLAPNIHRAITDPTGQNKKGAV
ncbi:MAG: CvpA family protein [Candidatus Omnitrophota bacterium]|nr:CvpA family protein [Candidatus Omnitrophota bacterium]